jgi:hypothetical protein
MNWLQIQIAARACNRLADLLFMAGEGRVAARGNLGGLFWVRDGQNNRYRSKGPLRG